MERRKFVRLILGSSSLLLGGCALLPSPSPVHGEGVEDAGPGGAPSPAAGPAKNPGGPASPPAEAEEGDILETRASEKSARLAPGQLADQHARSSHFDETLPGDIFVAGADLELLRTLTGKFRDLQKHVGFGHFNLVGMDEFFAKAESTGAGVTKAEKEQLERLFHFDAVKYGFTGARVFTEFTQTIDKNSVVKVPRSGHFLRRGLPLETYEKVKKDVGKSLILTSGIRGVAKQFHLFLEKAVESDGNLSKASRSLAPPGYSFHGRGDFDVGKIGYGVGNFTDDFAKTDEYKRLLDLGYVQIRYTQDNDLGVRFEPWHIKVES